MEEITRKVIKEVEETVWRASDGKIFEDEDECYAYEAELLLNDIPCWDSELNPCKDIERVMYVYLKDIYATEKFIKANNILMDFDCYGINIGDIGWFKLIVNMDTWICCNDIIKLYERDKKTDEIYKSILNLTAVETKGEENE